MVAAESLLVSLWPSGAKSRIESLSEDPSTLMGLFLRRVSSGAHYPPQ